MTTSGKLFPAPLSQCWHKAEQPFPSPEGSSISALSQSIFREKGISACTKLPILLSYHKINFLDLKCSALMCYSIRTGCTAVILLDASVFLFYS